jgi:mevalonate pyrophosphate decarboxylase
MKRILTIILTLSSVNAYAFSGAAIDKSFKEKEQSILAERKQQQEAIEAAKTPLNRLAEAEANFFNAKIKAKSDFETNIGSTCS